MGNTPSQEEKTQKAVRTFRDGGFICKFKKNKKDEAFCATEKEVKTTATDPGNYDPGSTDDHYHILPRENRHEPPKILRSFKKENVHCEVDYEISPYSGDIMATEVRSTNNKPSHQNFCRSKSEEIKRDVSYLWFEKD